MVKWGNHLSKKSNIMDLIIYLLNGKPCEYLGENTSIKKCGIHVIFIYFFNWLYNNWLYNILFQFCCFTVFVVVVVVVVVVLQHASCAFYSITKSCCWIQYRILQIYMKSQLLIDDENSDLFYSRSTCFFKNRNVNKV